MENFECPFTWKIDAAYHKTEYNSHDDEEYLPLMKLMRCIVHVYEDVKNKVDQQMILNKLHDCDSIIEEIKASAHPEISVKAVLFILKGTKCFVFRDLKMKSEFEKTLKTTTYIDVLEKRQVSTIKACKSIAWSNYRLAGTSKALKFIRDAIKDNSKCSLWHFILGKMLRRKRRDELFFAQPSIEEINSFKTAYDLEENVVYGVFLAQVFRENRMFNEAKKIYMKMLNNKPKGDTLLLRIALGCMGARDFEKAKFCLDSVSEKCSMYFHYRGLYHMKQQQYKEASSFLKKAVKDENLPAEHNYIFVMQKVDRNFDVLQYLLHMLDKYKDWPKTESQSILIQLGFTYYKKKGNFAESLKYFLDGIKINPESKSIKEFLPLLCIDKYVKKVNIFEFLSQHVLPIVLGNPDKFDRKTNCIAKELLKYCNKYRNVEFERMSDAFSKFHFRK